MRKILFIALGGLGGDVFSRGLRTLGDRARKELGAEFRYYHWNEGGKAGRAARSHKGPVVLIWHSAGKKGSDDFCNAYQRKVALAFAVDSWLPNQRANSHLTRVYSIVAGRGGRFHVNGNNVVGKFLYPDDTHTSIDDDRKLHDFVIEKIAALGKLGPKPKLPVSEGSKFKTTLVPLAHDWQKFMSPNKETQDQAAGQKAFFDVVRKEVLKPLSQEQVDGVKTLIFIWQKYFADKNPHEFLAFILGNAVRETGGKMTAIREANGRSRKDTLNKLNAWWRSGKAKSFGVRSKYWNYDGHGNPFGRGIFQITHRSNYVKGAAQILELTGVTVGLGKNYSLALDPLVSSILACVGSLSGSFRKGHKLANYLKGGTFDFYSSRNIVNGDKKKAGREVEGYCKGFLRALVAADKAVPDWLRTGDNKQSSLPVPVDPVKVPTMAGDLTLANLRKLPTADLHNILGVSGDAIKIISKILHERANPDVGNSISKPVEHSAPAAIPVFEAEQKKGNTTMSLIKGFLKSKTLGGIATAIFGTLLPTLGPLIGINMQPDDGATILAQIDHIVQAVGFLIAIYGRIVADKKLQFGG